MKKSIKYAGIAAATLLTVAPIAAPVVSQAAGTPAADTTVNKNADQSDVDKAVTDFTNQFGDRDSDDVTLTDNTALGEANATDITTFQGITNGIIKTATTADKLTLLNDANQDAQVYYTITDAKGNLYDGGVNGGTFDQYNTAASDDNYLPATVNVYMKYKNLSDGKFGSFSKVATFKINATNDNELKTVNAKFTTPMNVAKNSKTAATRLVNAANVSLLDQDGNSLATKSVSIPDGYYYTYSAAMDAAKTQPVTGLGNVTTSDISQNDAKTATDEFKTAGTYYQTVTYEAKANSALQTMLQKFTTDPTGYTVLVNGKKAASGYDFVTSGDTITFVRAINVSDNEAQWTTTDTTGVVTTKSDSAYYTLKNDEGNTITNRALAKNSAWKTNAVRTDQNGNKQYRVGASEWIDANDVTFSDKATDGNTEGAYTDVTDVTNMKVNLAAPSSFIYMLYNDEGKQVTSRALSGDSNWAVDKKAVNADGVTVYRVATNEWVQAGTGVSFIAR
ncbi:hypothetical protein D1B17_10620 [Companilactobacillus zhachilii]|uniref:Surface layer protein A domain-containing protein n=1 Tax=Companilactobacillus zhachilii TaxID=2304606 RepID=A0A386PX10_9LACO|nr:hypothetical protein [Companilactobacillus zhachilii]AYE39057.1 hypothetical protein D1B17_10620 [Companilactobacillus zhachilii]